MNRNHFPSNTIKPTAVWGYFDVVRTWLENPLGSKPVEQLRRLCGGVLTVRSERARFCPQYRQQITLRQPSNAALNFLNDCCADAFINYVEIAIDLAFDHASERNEAFAFLHRHFCRRHHGKKQQIQFYADGPSGPQRQSDIYLAQTRYDAGRSAPNRLVFYKEPWSRQTGELVSLVHAEWRCTKAEAVRSLGIASTADLVEFDHHRFWQRRLLLLDALPGRLGRFIRNCDSGRRSRVETPEDRLLGTEILEEHDSIQGMIDALGKSYRIRRALIEISNDAWLPSLISSYQQDLPTHSIADQHPADQTSLASSSRPKSAA